MKLLLTLAVALAATVGTSSTIDSGYPPDRYQVDGSAASATFLSGQEPINMLCGAAPAGFHTLACVKPGAHLILPNPCGTAFLGEDYAKIACHELGHLNGWPADHPRP